MFGWMISVGCGGWEHSSETSHVRNSPRCFSPGMATIRADVNNFVAQMMEDTEGSQASGLELYLLRLVKYLRS